MSALAPAAASAPALDPASALHHHAPEIAREVALEITQSPDSPEQHHAAHAADHGPDHASHAEHSAGCAPQASGHPGGRDRKSTRLNSSHLVISYAVFCLKKKKRR